MSTDDRRPGFDDAGLLRRGLSASNRWTRNRRTSIGGFVRIAMVGFTPRSGGGRINPTHFVSNLPIIAARGRRAGAIRSVSPLTRQACGHDESKSILC